MLARRARRLAVWRYGAVVSDASSLLCRLSGALCRTGYAVTVTLTPPLTHPLPASIKQMEAAVTST